MDSRDGKHLTPPLPGPERPAGVGWEWRPVMTDPPWGHPRCGSRDQSPARSPRVQATPTSRPLPPLPACRINAPRPVLCPARSRRARDRVVRPATPPRVCGRRRRIVAHRVCARSGVRSSSHMRRKAAPAQREAFPPADRVRVRLDGRNPRPNPPGLLRRLFASRTQSRSQDLHSRRSRRRMNEEDQLARFFPTCPKVVDGGLITDRPDLANRD